MKKLELKQLIKQIIKESISVDQVDFNDKFSVKEYLQNKYQLKISGLYTRITFNVYIDLEKQKDIYNGDYEIIENVRLTMRNQFIHMLQDKYEYYFDIKNLELNSFYLSHQDLTISCVCSVD